MLVVLHLVVWIVVSDDSVGLGQSAQICVILALFLVSEGLRVCVVILHHLLLLHEVLLLLHLFVRPTFLFVELRIFKSLMALWREGRLLHLLRLPELLMHLMLLILRSV